MLVTWQAKSFLRSMLKMETFFEFLDREPKFPQSGSLKPEKLEGKIEFQNVSFCYPTRPNSHVLKVHCDYLRVYIIVWACNQNLTVFSSFI